MRMLPSLSPMDELNLKAAVHGVSLFLSIYFTKCIHLLASIQQVVVFKRQVFDGMSIA